ncbi:hypothetical protein [Candidatus Regiella endosymbiont of Tuberolachnus salignus]|uniref:hypothetical protein n=1 Tax=Candidatus Regiella endosymbiont of Tuberolachnus salignus TaxID=3077956 RepID=UPI0030D0FAE3
MAKFSLQLAQGWADLIPETPINVSGFKAEIDQANWILTTATHTLNDQGFTTALAVEYAGWIRPDFRIRVNQTFIDYRRGKITKETPKRQPHRDEGSGLPEFRKAKAMQIVMEVAEKTFAWATLLSPLSRQGVIAGLINPLAGCEVVPLPLLVEKLYRASEIGKLFDVSANKIGRIANDNDMKTEQYGEYHLDKSRHSDKQVQAFRYNNHALNTFRHILIAEQEAKEHALV